MSNRIISEELHEGKLAVNHLLVCNKVHVHVYQIQSVFLDLNRYMKCKSPCKISKWNVVHLFQCKKS